MNGLRKSKKVTKNGQSQGIQLFIFWVSRKICESWHQRQIYLATTALPITEAF